MDTQALLLSTKPSTTQTSGLTFKLPVSHSTPQLFPEIQPHSSQTPPQNDIINPKDSILIRSDSSLPRSGLHRSKTSPALLGMNELQKAVEDESQKPETQSGSIIRQGIVLLVLYLVLGIVIYSCNRENFSGVETNPIVDALYFCIVTMCTIGYGDIAPLTPGTKLFACFFVLIGFGFIDILLSGVVNYVLDLQENMILTGIQVNKAKSRDGFSARDYIIDVEKGRMRIRLKVGLALLVVLLCIGTGAVVLCFFEDLDWIDSVYLSVMSVTTVGYGDRAFKTMSGRLFAAVWLLVSTLAVARAFLYLAEARVNKRHRMIAKYVLHRGITVEDLLAADINQHGFIRYVTLIPYFFAATVLKFLCLSIFFFFYHWATCFQFV